MNIISHRGLWADRTERNRPRAFERSFDAGFGTETDLRDRAGTLVIAHDMADDDAITLDDLLAILGRRALPLALNVKASGLAASLAERMRPHRDAVWFTFDMAVPDLLDHLRLGLPAYTRVSEHERAPACYDRAAGIWLDAFERDWFTEDDIAGFVRDGKPVCVVSPELHGRDPQAVWSLLRAAALADHSSLTLCTDRPEAARAFFGRAA